jgi:hypothetical protein
LGSFNRASGFAEALRKRASQGATMSDDDLSLQAEGRSFKTVCYKLRLIPKIINIWNALQIKADLTRDPVE